MRNLIFSALLLLAANAIHAQIAFEEEGNWSDVLAKAKAEDKLVFLDAYAVWCGPCKMMDRNVFSQERVGDYFNAKFVNYRMDMEKGEGPEVAQKYGVRAYPTFLFINGDGELVHTGVGYQEADQFLELAADAADPANNMRAMNRMWENGNRESDFLLRYAYAKLEAYDGSHGPVAEAYLAGQDDWGTEENIAFIFRFADNPDSKLFDYILENREDFEHVVGEDQVKGKIMQMSLRLALGQKEGGTLEKAEAIIAKAYPGDAAMLNNQLRMYYYRYTENVEKFAEEAVTYYNGLEAPSADELNEIAWTFYEQVEDKAMLKQALEWAKKSVEIKEGYYNLDTLAALYYKLGKKKPALKAADKAIAAAEADGMDPGETKKLKEKIKAL